MINLLIDNLYTRVEITGETGGQDLDTIVRATKIVIRYYSKRKGAAHGEWKERDVHYYRSESRDFPTGLLPRVYAAAKTAGAQVSFDDRREKPGADDHPDLRLSLPSLPTSQADYSFQELAVDDAIKVGRGLLHYPTGAGKTVIMARVIDRLKVDSLVIVPNLTLVNQTYTKFQDYFGEHAVGMLGEGKRLNPGAPIIIATQQTLYSVFKRSEIRRVVEECAPLMTSDGEYRRCFTYFATQVPECVVEYTSEYYVKDGREWSRCNQELYEAAPERQRHELKIPTVIDPGIALDLVRSWPRFGDLVNRFKLMFIDECHHTACSGAQNVRDKYTGKWVQKENLSNTWWEVAMAIPAYYRFGMSATLNTADSPNNQFVLESVCGRVISSIGVSDLIDRNVLCPVRATMIRICSPARTVWATKYIYEKVEGKLVRTGVKEPGAYEYNILNNERRNQIIVDLALDCQARGAHVLIIVERIKDQGWKLAHEIGEDRCVFLTGGHTKQERDRGISDVKSNGKILIGTIFKEGFDMPAIDTLIIAGGGKSMKATIQKLGRVLRVSKDKDYATLYDFYDDDQGSMCTKHSEIRRQIYAGEPKYELKIVDEKEYNAAKKTFATADLRP
jgi:superfamily II DNA or RNA helicase